MTYWQLQRRITIMLAAGWPSALVWASNVTLTQTLSSLSFTVCALVAVLSTLSGLTALAMRIDAELRTSASRVLPRPWLFASAHMLGSWLAGILMFAVGEANNINDWVEIILIILGSFGGAKTIEYMTERYLPVAGKKT